MSVCNLEHCAAFHCIISYKTLDVNGEIQVNVPFRASASTIGNHSEDATYTLSTVPYNPLEST